MNATDPVDAFVYMELSSTKEILAIVHQSVTTIAKILQGTEMLTPKSQKEATELLKGGVPISWQSQWEGPENPNEWIGVVNKKANALIMWAQRVQQK